MKCAPHGTRRGRPPSDARRGTRDVGRNDTGVVPYGVGRAMPRRGARNDTGGVPYGRCGRCPGARGVSCGRCHGAGRGTTQGAFLRGRCGRCTGAGGKKPAAPRLSPRDDGEYTRGASEFQKHAHGDYGQRPQQHKHEQEARADVTGGQELHKHRYNADGGG